MKILLTRPEHDAKALADLLHAAGHSTIIEPLLTIVETIRPLDPSGAQAFLVTSANGARALAKATTDRSLPTLAVGEATADTLRTLCFTDVQAADGDVTSLVNLAKTRLSPDRGYLLHAAGSVVAGDLAGDLTAAGFEVRREVLYRAEPIDRLDSTLFDQRIDAALFFSPRTGAVFARLMQSAGLADRCLDTEALCLSAAVAETVSGLPWRTVRIAERPSQAALLNLIGIE